ncbi:MAG TPA: TolC family protein [Burkholderiales bacterium]|nr:TolC family protein [Burkholderiales bacterium]
MESRSLDDERLRRFIAAGVSLRGETARPVYWNLESLSLAALYYHPDLDLARARLAAARASITTVRQVPNPLLDLGLTYNATTATPSAWTVGLMVNFIIETFGKRAYRTAEAQFLAEAAKDDLAGATWLVRAKVRDAMLLLWSGNERLARTRQRLSEQEALVRLIERRFELGGASSLEVTRERMNRNQVSLAVREAERQVREGRARLGQAVGIPLGSLDGAKISLEDFAAETGPGDVSDGALREKALSTRSDVQSLLAEYNAAQAALQLQIARQYPDLRIGPGYTYDQGDHKYDLRLGSELPVFNQNQGPVAQAEARREEVAARFSALQAQVIGAIDEAFTSYRSATEARRTADASAAEARKRLEGVRRGFNAGQFDRPTLVGAQIELSAAELSTVDAMAAERRAIGLLEDALHLPLFGAKSPLPIEERNPRLAVEFRR